MVTIPNQSSVPKAFELFDAAGRLPAGSHYERLVDVCEELVRFTWLVRDNAVEIPEPHEFKARVSFGHGGHTHDYDLAFVEGHGHDNDHGEGRAYDALQGGEYMDAHALAHADQINRRLRNREVTTWQIIAVDLTGGLMPCAAAITVLLLCQQLKRIALGVVLVGFSALGLPSRCLWPASLRPLASTRSESAGLAFMLSHGGRHMPSVR